ncbi:MAG: ATP-binding cassette domain-containing protein [Candidatus Aenigmarchaeota archaeon]|nr:ATP-binding cassette domain-containing protein [Candidatus Aenigmarchaeota archaeon]
MSHVVVNRLSHTFTSRKEKLEVLDELSFEVFPTEVVTILGPSGCGKSTLLRCLAGLLVPSEGTIEIDGQSPDILRQKKELGFGFQEPSLMDWRTVEDNISLPAELGIQDGALSELKLRIDDMLNLIRMTNFRRHYPPQLSAGMKHRTALARALILEPKILLLDEPLAGLDLLTRRELMGQITTLLERQKCTTVIVTHSVEEAVFWGDRVILLTHRPASIVQIIEHHGQRPRKLAYAESMEFHHLVDRCSDLILGLSKSNHE